MRWTLPEIPLELARPTRIRSRCKICGAVADLMDVVDFNKICALEDHYKFGLSGVPVYYHMCRSCQFVFTEFFDRWDTDKFGKFIYNDDYARVDGGYVGPRPARQAEMLDQMFDGNKQISVLDYGSGSGLTARALAAKGYTGVECYDPFSQPLRPSRKVDVIVAMAVVEHSPRPVQTFGDMLSLLNQGGVILCTTALMTAEVRPERGNWWYVGPRNGHVSLFTHKAIGAIGAKLGLTYFVKSGLACLFLGEPNDVARHVTRGALHRFSYIRALAPTTAAETPAGCWGNLESRAERSFRWTKSSRVVLQPPLLAPGAHEILLEIPVAFQMRPEFAAGCKVSLDGQEFSLTEERRIDGDVLTAQFKVASPPTQLCLMTPDPQPPSESQPVLDTRPLGLAILARSPTASDRARQSPGGALAIG